jgi:hypothetical protein
MSRHIFPCLNCTSRRIGCHAKCEAYKNAAAANEAANERERKENTFITGKEPMYVTKKRTTMRNKGYAGREKK